MGVPDAVNVLATVVLFVPPVWSIVVANALARPPVVISSGSVVSHAAAPVSSVVSAIKWEPLVPADVLV